MANDRVFIAPDVTLFDQPWFDGLSDGGVRALFALLRYVKLGAPSQKKSGRAPRIEPAVAARQWNVGGGAAAVREMETAAMSGKRPFLVVEDGFWVVTDRLIFRSESSALRDAKAGQTEHEEPDAPETDPTEDLTAFDRQTPSNGVKPDHPCHVTGSGSGFPSPSGSPSGVPPSAGEGKPSPAGAPAHEGASARGGALAGAAFVAEPRREFEPPPDPPPPREPAEPFRSVNALLRLCAELTNGLEPTAAEVRPHLKEGSAVRQMIAKHGVERAAAVWVYAQGCKRGKGGMSWAAVWSQQRELVASMPKAAPKVGQKDVWDEGAELLLATTGRAI